METIIVSDFNLLINFLKEKLHHSTFKTIMLSKSIKKTSKLFHVTQIFPILNPILSFWTWFYLVHFLFFKLRIEKKTHKSNFLHNGLVYKTSYLML